MGWKPDLTVAAVIHDRGRFLVVEERIRQRLVFNQPAGHVEDGESPVQAVVREVAEETGCAFDPAYLLGIYLWRDPKTLRTTLRFAYVGLVGDRDIHQVLDTGIIATHWLSREELAARATRLRTPLVLQCIDDYLAGKRMPLDTVHCALSACASS